MKNSLKISELETELNIKLTEVNSIDDLFDIEKNNIFLLKMKVL